ncbi:MAG: hypothetical protein IJ748_07920 [Bacteroidales bacterium]|nr:hypothetical protein [Bacteroidales bacterium]
MKYYIFLLLAFVPILVFSQNISLQQLTSSSVTIAYSIEAPETLYLYDNDTVYYEDFAYFPNTNEYQYYEKFLWDIPSSYLRVAGAKGKILEGNGAIVLSKSSVFETPEIDIEKSFNGSKYLYNLSVALSKKSGSADLYVSDEGHSSSFSKSESSNLSHISITFSASTTKSTSYEISKILVTIPKDYCNKRSVDLTDLSGTYTMDNLSPNSKYVIVLGEDTLSFTTKKEKTLDSVNKVSDTYAEIYFTDNTNSGKKLKIMNKGSLYNFTDDLIISEVFQKSSDASLIELYNGTGRDICLKDYKLKAHRSSTLMAEYTFTDRDTLKHDEALVFFKSFDKLSAPIENAGKFYIGEDILSNYPIVLMNGSDTIDFFGNNADTNTSTGWTCGDLKTKGSVLKRKSSVFCGIKTNPKTGFPTLCSEWTGTNSTSASDFLNFGLHTIDATILRADIENINIGTEIPVENITLQDGYYTVSDLQPNTFYVAYLTSSDGEIVYGCQSFRTKGLTQRTVSGEWTDENWTEGKPTYNDIVEIGQNTLVVIPEGTLASCNTLILKDGAEIKNNGNLNVKNYQVEKSLLGYETEDIPGWYLMGLPIIASQDNQSYISTTMSAFEDNDDIDLYYWDEAYTDDDVQGLWRNFKDYDLSQPFFQQGRGYLVAYAENRLNIFDGKINDEDSYTLLENATRSGETQYHGWHLAANPYPFSLSLDDIVKENFTPPSLLKQDGNYQTMTSRDRIKPFEGFFVQTTEDGNNLFRVNKKSNPTSLPVLKSNLDSVKYLSFSVVGEDGSDRLLLAFDNSFSESLDWQTDNHKLTGLGDAPEIYAVFNNEAFAVNVLPSSADTLYIDLRCKIKKGGEYSMVFTADGVYPYQEVVLQNRKTGEALVDFTNSDTYSFFADQTMEEDGFLLSFARKSVGIDRDILTSNFINISQKGRIVKAYSNEPLRLLTLYSSDGKQLLQSDSSEIEIKQTGLFILKVQTTKNEKVFKITVF